MNNPKIKNFATISDEETNNFKASVGRFPEEARYSDRLLYLYENLASNLPGFPRDLTPILQMYWTCFRGFLISSQLMFQAHIPEAYTLISRSAEAAASARKMSIYPEKIPGWIEAEKGTSRPFIRMLGTLFPKGDEVIYPDVFGIYELTSEYGRHPSFKSTIFFSGFGRMETENKVDFTYCDSENETNLKQGINFQIYAYLEFLSVFRVVFNKYLTKEWTKEYEQFESEYGVFKETLRSVFQSG
jgi:hypothetical protein